MPHPRSGRGETRPPARWTKPAAAVTAAAAAAGVWALTAGAPFSPPSARAATVPVAPAPAATPAAAAPPPAPVVVPPLPPPLDPGNLDAQVKPGEDFYRYANGGWLARHPVPPEYSRWGSFEELVERNDATLHELLEACAARTGSDPAPGQPGDVRRLVGDFYASGMDVAQANAAGVQPLAPEFAALARLTTPADLPGLVARLHLLGVAQSFSVGSALDEKDTVAQVAVLGQGGLGLPDRDYYLKDDPRSRELRALYQEHVGRMFALLGEAPPEAAAAARTVVRVETELAKASKTRVELRDPNGNYHRLSLAELAKSAPGFDWPDYFRRLGLAEAQLQKIDVAQPEFCARFAQLAAELPAADWRTYLRWHLVHSLAANLSDPFVDESFRFYGQTLTGTKENLPRWRRVLQETDAGLGDALGQLYVERTFPPAAKERALRLVNDLKGVLRERIEGLSWMGPQTKAAALAKLDRLGVKIGYPDRWRDYGSLAVKRQPYVLNVLAANAYEVRRDLAKIGQPVDRTEWQMTPPTVNAYYEPTRNEIVFPAGILQPPFFSADADDAVNYGGIGAVIGHEMTHGFDDQGRQYDAAGNLQDWWTPEDAKRFQERGELIVQQFDRYAPLPNQHVNGQLTEGENIADLGGVKIAYAALEKALARLPAAERDRPIDGFTPAQRFFLAWAQVWRNNIRPEALQMRLVTDPHSPGQFRVIGPLANLPEFAAAFHLTPRDPMVRPEDQQVRIW